MLTKLLFVFARLIGPLGVLLQISLLARVLSSEQFGAFLELYAWSIVATALSDFGMMNVLFAALRRPGVGQPAVNDAYSRAILIKSVASFTLFAVATAAVGYGQGIEWLFAALLGIVLPGGDQALTAMRGRSLPAVEATVLAVEQVVGLAVVALLSLYGGLTALQVLIVLTVVGGLRCLVSAAICKYFLGLQYVSPFPVTGQAALPWLLRLVVSASPAALSVIVTQSFSRIPSLTLRGFMEPRDFAVFIAIFTVLWRGHLVVTALLQSSFRSSGSGRFARSPWRLGFLAALLGTACSLPVAMFPRAVVATFLGPDLADSSQYAALAITVVPLMYAVIALQLFLQYESRYWLVLGSCVAGFSVEVMMLASGGFRDLWAVGPVIASGVVFLAVCAIGIRIDQANVATKPLLTGTSPT